MPDKSLDPGDALKPLESLVDGLAAKFIGHPGFMWTTDGFEVLQVAMIWSGFEPLRRQ
jgi:hypothetical protein